MGDLTIKDNDLIRLRHTDNKELSDLKPFQKDIYLFTTYIAGTTHVEGILELEPHINIGDRLNFVRKPGNTYDKNAIEIRNIDNVKLGFVPQKDNIIFSRLMDAGKMLFAKITSKEMKGKWLYITIDIYLYDL